MRPLSSAVRAARASILVAAAAPDAPLLPTAVQEAELRGRVVSQAGQPLQGANVYVTELGISVGTNAAGHYVLTVPAARVANQTVLLRVRSVGFAPQAREVVVRPGVQTADFVLAPDVTRLSEVVVSGVTLPGLQGKVDFSGSPIAQPRRARGNTEEYARIDDNPFVTTRSAPLSTFSVDVDRASYGNVRRHLLQQRTLPPPDAVRVEELINYFPYAYAEPTGEHPIAVSSEVARAPWAPQHLLVRVGLQTRRVALDALPPNNLVFLVDVSGSMDEPNKLPLVQRSLRLLVHELRPVDRVAIVVYAGAAGLVLPSTPASEKTIILDAIDRLRAGGSTAGGAGIRLAYDVARASQLAGGNNRVVLATDGDFNVGVSSTSELVRLVEERRAEGTALTVLGFGMGNLKDGRLEQLADRGNGNYAYVDDLLEARKTLVTEAGGTLATVASDVKLQVEFNPRLVRGYRLVGYENRLLADEDFADDAKDAGDVGAGHSVTALYEVVPVGAATTTELRTAPSLRYQAERVASAGARRDELLTVSLRYKRPGESRSRLLRHPVLDRRDAPSSELAFAAAVAGFGMLLRDSPYRGSMSWAAVRELAAPAVGDDPHGYRAAFLELVATAERLPARRTAQR